jgi:sporulation integral membrane protein YlbJ
MFRTHKTKSHAVTLFLGSIAFFLVVSLVLFPEEAFHSSLKGLIIWWEVVFPALLPFFIASEILMGFGVVHFMGVLLEPMMRPIFRVPGTGAFVMAMGLASGYPIGAKLTARLREQNLITRSEGERLVSFTNTADPLFMFGAVAVGFFHDVTLGVIIAIAHYTSSLILGFLMRFHDPHGESTIMPVTTHGNMFTRALRAMHRARIQDGRTLGQLMGDAVTSSMNTLMLIGGFIMMFSVIIKVLTIINVTEFFSVLIGIILLPLGVPQGLFPALFSGFFEITLGSQLAANAPGQVSLAWKVAIASGIIAWSSMSVHAQVASILSTTDIRYTPYLFARIIHGFLAAALTLILWDPVERWVQASALPAFVTQTVYTQSSDISSTLSFLSLKLLLIVMALWIVSMVFDKWQTGTKPWKINR